MKPEQLCEALQKKAVDSERSKLESALACLKQVGNFNDSFTFDVHNKKGEQFTVTAGDVLLDLKIALIESKKDNLCREEIQKFMKSVEKFRSHVDGLGEYLEQ